MEITDEMKIGWNACRRQVYHLAEHIQDRIPISGDIFTDFERGERYMAKGFAKALNAFEAEDCDFLKEAALAAAPASAEPVLTDAERFTMQDHQRLLRQSDVEGICQSPTMCFEYSDRARCGPCAIQQAAKHGVETDNTLPFAPEQYRLQRKLKAAPEAIRSAGLKARDALLERMAGSGSVDNDLADHLSSIVEACVTASITIDT